jgi:hypothetical protein
MLGQGQERESAAAASNIPETMKSVYWDEIGAKTKVLGDININRYIELVCAEAERNILGLLTRVLEPNDFARCAAAILGTDIRVKNDE